MGYLDFKNTLLFLIGIVNLVFGSVIYLKNRRSKTNLWFFLVALSVTFWVFSMFFFRSFEFASVLGARMLYLSASLIPVSFLYFTFVFPKDKINFNVPQKYLLPIPFILAAAASLWPDFLITAVRLVPNGENIIFFNQKVHLFYAIYIVGYFVFSYVVLFKKYLKSSGALKMQVQYIFAGTLISTLIGVNTNLIMPYMGIFDLNWLGQIMTSVMIIFIAYAIAKHHLMNIKVIATELFSGGIVMVLLIVFLTSETAMEWFVKGGLLVVGSIFSYLLIRSVLKEVRTREELEDLTEKLKSANARLRQLDEAKSEFISVASHQLRAPLTSIKGYSSMVLEGAYGQMPGKMKEVIERIFQSSQRLILTIGDFLDISRIESGKMKYDFADFAFKDLVKSITDDFAANIKNKEEVTLKFSSGEGDFKIKADYGKIRQVVSNLIDNAIKYTPKGTVAVSLARDESAKKVLLKIEDSGVGISPETIPTLFQKFSRAKGISKLHTDGSGLGLYVASEMVKAHNGRIWVESKGEGKGSAFFVELPVSQPVENGGKMV
ncbi:MAG: hypothetical protein GXP44_02535 [bacterium]|nr:hypothetical protein [bacterium]